jgi:hypothetical protein
MRASAVVRPLVLVAGVIALGACSSASGAGSPGASTTAAVETAGPTTTVTDSMTDSGTDATTTTATDSMTDSATDATTTATDGGPASTSSTVAATTTPTSATPTTDRPGVVGAEALTGRWAHYDVVAYEDGLLKTLIISYGFDDFTVDDGRVVDTTTFCFSEQRTDQPIETSLSDAATQAIEPPPTLIEVDTVEGTLRIRRPATPTPVGIRLDDPFEDALPTDPDDPRIVDDDGDGKPGITVRIHVNDEIDGELYIARREIFAYEALLTAPDRLVGTVTDESEQLVIGASDPIFETEAAWVQHPDPAKSPIILQRVDENWDCDRLAAERDDLFPPTPDVDW